ncbi:MAG TPA: hypothetical protein VMU41_12985 [Candidatus Binataceae bacterium]|nr:hypothetical protein [Candidatus Binataceae bacterium]
MAEIIHIREFQEERRRAIQRHANHQSLEQAVRLIRGSLADAALELRDAEPANQPELLDRIERLTAMVRYGLRMIGDDTAPVRRQS